MDLQWMLSISRYETSFMVAGGWDVLDEDIKYAYMMSRAMSMLHISCSVHNGFELASMGDCLILLGRGQ